MTRQDDRETPPSGRVRQLNPQEGEELRAVESADGELYIVGEHRDIVPLGGPEDLSDPAEIDDDRPVDAYEVGGVELLLETREAFVEKMPFAPRVEIEVIALRLNPVDIAHPDDRNLLERPDRDDLTVTPGTGNFVQQLSDLFAQELSCGGIFCRDRLPHAIERRRKPFRIDRLEKIIERPHIEGPDRELIISGDEHNRRKFLPVEVRQDVEAVQLGPLDIEKDQVGAFQVDLFDGFKPVGAFAGDLDILFARKEFADALPAQRLVVDDQCADPTHRGHPGG